MTKPRIWSSNVEPQLAGVKFWAHKILESGKSAAHVRRNIIEFHISITNKNLRSPGCAIYWAALIVWHYGYVALERKRAARPPNIGYMRRWKECDRNISETNASKWDFKTRKRQAAKLWLWWSMKLFGYGPEVCESMQTLGNWFGDCWVNYGFCRLFWEIVAYGYDYDTNVLFLIPVRAQFDQIPVESFQMKRWNSAAIQKMFFSGV